MRSAAGVVALLLSLVSPAGAELNLRVSVGSTTWSAQSPSGAVQICDEQPEMAIVRSKAGVEATPVRVGVRASVELLSNTDVVVVRFQHVGVLLRYSVGRQSAVVVDRSEFERRLVLLPGRKVESVDSRSGAKVCIRR